MFSQNKFLSYVVPKESDLVFFLGGVCGKYESNFSIKSYLNIIYRDGYFLDAIYDILFEKEGFGVEGADCWYSDLNSPGYNFHGIEFEIGGVNDLYNQICVTEQVCFEYLRKACNRFL